MLACLAAPERSGAHSILIESVPPHGAALEAAPQTLFLRFNAKIEPSMTRVSLVDRQNKKTPLEMSGDSTVDRIVVRVPALAPGVYSVVYKVLATDGHVTEGSFRFTVLAR